MAAKGKGAGKTPPHPAAVAAEVRNASKYAPIVASLVAHVAESECAHAASAADAVKRVKRKLHQLVGAYLDSGPPARKFLDALSAAEDETARRQACLRILAQHASTRERVPALESFYAAVFAGLPPPQRVLDLACGLNPVARPFMPLPAECELACYDAHESLVAVVLEALARLGYPAAGAGWNLLEPPPPLAADVALLLKTVPCLTQADPNAGRRLIERIDAPVIVVSFPVGSLSGGKRGMPLHYRAQFEAMMAGSDLRIKEIDAPGELVFRLHRDHTGEASHTGG